MINASRPRIYLATSNPGKIRDFNAAAEVLGITVQSIPGLDRLPQPMEDGPTFEANARIKAEYYSQQVPGQFVAADDSGLVVDALNGAPGVHSARYAAMRGGAEASHVNSSDEDNNRQLMTDVARLPPSSRSGKFVCVIAVARNGRTLQTFYGEVKGQLLASPRGEFGFGYDPLFYFPELGTTFGEIPLESKVKYSHRGQAFRRMLEWYKTEEHQLIGETDQH